METSSALGTHNKISVQGLLFKKFGLKEEKEKYETKIRYVTFVS